MCRVVLRDVLSDVRSVFSVCVVWSGVSSDVRCLVCHVVLRDVLSDVRSVFSICVVLRDVSSDVRCLVFVSSCVTCRLM